MAISAVNTRGTAKKTLQHLADVVVTPEQVRAFAEATGDCNPIHLDEGAARKFGLNGAIAHGGLITGIVSRVMFEKFGDGVMPGRIGKTTFLLPVYTGSKISIFFQVAKERGNAKVVDVQVYVDGNVVLTLKNILLVIP